MAKQRIVNTRFWSDPWVVEKLNPLSRYLFLYLLTNEHTNLSGIYEMSIYTISTETGIEKDMLLKTMLQELEPKVKYINNWVVITNFPSHQNTENPKIMAGIQRELGNVPKEILDSAITYGYPITLNLTKLNLSGDKKNMKNYNERSHSDEGDEPSIDIDTREITEVKKVTKIPKNTTALRLQSLFNGMVKKDIGVTISSSMFGYMRCIAALNEGLTEKQVSELFEDWFSSGKSDEDKVSLTACLSNNAINKFKVRENL